MKEEWMNCIDTGEITTLKHFYTDAGLDPAGTTDLFSETSGTSPLLYACEHGKLDIVKWLVNTGAHPTQHKKTLQSSEDDYGLTALPLATKGGQLSVVVWLLAEGGSNLDEETDEFGLNSFLLSAYFGHLDIVQWFIKALQRDPNEQNKDDRGEGETPLTLAACGGHLHVVQWLLQDAGADPELKDQQQDSALQYAAAHNRLEVVQWLVAEGHCDLSQVNQRGHSAFMTAAMNDSLEVVKWLAEEANVDPLQEREVGTDGAPVLIAALNNALAVLKWLVETAGCPLNESSNSYTTLLLASATDSFETVQYLVKSGRCDPNEEKTKEGKTALLLAAEKGYLTQLQWLVEQPDVDLKVKDNLGRTALLAAAAEGHCAIVEYLVVSAGVNPRAEKDNYDQTAFILAADYANLDVFKFLLTQVGNQYTLRDCNTEDYNALVLCARNGWFEMVKTLLLESTATNQFAQRKDAARFALLHNHLQIAQWLLLDAWCLEYQTTHTECEPDGIDVGDLEEKQGYELALLTEEVTDSHVHWWLARQGWISHNLVADMDDTPSCWVVSSHHLFPPTFHWFVGVLFWVFCQKCALFVPPEVRGLVVQCWPSNAFSPRVLKLKAAASPTISAPQPLSD